MPIEFKRIDHLLISIPVGKVEEAKHFYLEVLGLKQIPKPANVLKNGGFWALIANIELHIGVEAAVGPPSKRHPAFEIEDLEGARGYLKGKGVRIKEYEPLPNFNRFSFFDPFDNRIELLEKIK